MIPLLVAVFALAAALKAARPRATAASMAALGLPRPALLARAVPAVEAAVVVALIVEPAYGSGAALALLGPFTILLVEVVRSGRQVSCGCLGALDRRPVSWRTVARNLVLMVVAVATMTVPALRWPPLEGEQVAAAAPAVLLMAPAALLVVLAVQLWSLRRTLGRLWSVELAGEVAPTRRRRLATVPAHPPTLPPGSPTRRTR